MLAISSFPRRSERAWRGIARGLDHEAQNPGKNYLCPTITPATTTAVWGECCSACASNAANKLQVHDVTILIPVSRSQTQLQSLLATIVCYREAATAMRVKNWHSPTLISVPSSCLAFLRKSVSANVESCRGLYSSMRYRSTSLDFPTAESPKSITCAARQGQGGECDESEFMLFVSSHMPKCKLIGLGKLIFLVQ